MVFFPKQIETLAPALVGTIGFTVIVTVSLLEQPLASVTVTVYCVVIGGVATGLEIFGLLSVPAGAHE